MRYLLVSLFLVVFSLSAQAAITREDLQELVYQGDIEAVENAIAEAHQESLSGAISYDDLRGLIGVLTRTHPDTVDFRNAWLKTYPGSPYAQSAKIWELYNTGFDIRGADTSNNTSRTALREFYRLHQDAMAMAEAAYEITPDFVPISDAILRLQRTTKALPNREVGRLIEDIMETAPNFGSLSRASTLSDRMWGGYGQEFNVRLCQTFHDQVPEYPDLSADACTVALFATNRQLRSNWNFVVDVLDRDDHELLTYARVLRAIRRQTDSDKQLIAEYLMSVDLSDPWISEPLQVANEVARLGYSSIPWDYSSFRDDFKARVLDAVRTQFEHDPYRQSLIEVLLGENRSVRVTNRQQKEAERLYYLRLAMLEPYNARRWAIAANAIHTSFSNQSYFLNTRDVASINAIAYSDHGLWAISNYLQKKVGQLVWYFETENRSHPMTTLRRPSEEVFIAEVGCRVARLIRLFEDAAISHPDARNRVDGLRANLNLTEITTDLQKRGTCDHIWDASIENLRFQPVEIDRRYLLDHPENWLVPRHPDEYLAFISSYPR